MHTNKQELKIQTQSNKRILICMRGSGATFKRQASLNMFSIYVLAVCSATWHQELCRQEGEWPVTVLLPASFSWQKAPRTQKKWSIISLSLIWFQVHKRCWKKLLLNVGKKKKNTEYICNKASWTDFFFNYCNSIGAISLWVGTIICTT